MTKTHMKLIMREILGHYSNGRALSYDEARALGRTMGREALPTSNPHRVWARVREELGLAHPESITRGQAFTRAFVTNR